MAIPQRNSSYFPSPEEESGGKKEEAAPAPLSFLRLLLQERVSPHMAGRCETGCLNLSAQEDCFSLLATYCFFVSILKTDNPVNCSEQKITKSALEGENSP